MRCLRVQKLKHSSSIRVLLLDTIHHVPLGLDGRDLAVVTLVEEVQMLLDTWIRGQ